MPVQVPTAPCVRSEAWRGSPLQMGCNQQLAHGLLRAAAWPGLRGPFSPHAAEGAPRPARRELATAPCRAAGCAAPAEALSALKERARCRQGLQSMFGARTKQSACIRVGGGTCSNKAELASTRVPPGRPGAPAGKSRPAGVRLALALRTVARGALGPSPVL